MPSITPGGGGGGGSAVAFPDRGNWTPNTNYLKGEFVTAPTGDLVSAKATFISGATYDPANWNVRARRGSDANPILDRGEWAPNTTYGAGDMVSYDGEIFTAKAAFTSGAVFDATNWNRRVKKGAPGPILVGRGAWAPATSYAANDMVTYTGGTYYANAAFISGTVFDPTKWTVLVASPLMLTAAWTGGTPGNVALRTDAGTLTDARPADKTGLSTRRLYYRDPAGRIWQPGGPVPGVFTSGQIGQVVALTVKPTATGSNLATHAEGAPGTLAATSTRVYERLGIVESVDTWRFEPDDPWILPDAMTTYQIIPSTLTAGQALTGIMAEQWNTNGMDTSVVDDATSPSGKAININVLNTNRHARRIVAPGDVQDGEVSVLGKMLGTVAASRSLRLHIGLAGASTSSQQAPGGVAGPGEIGYTLDLQGDGRLRIWRYVNGASNSTTPMADKNIGALVADQWYRLVFKRVENNLLARAYLWNTGTPVPAWDFEIVNAELPAAAPVGFAANNGSSGTQSYRFAELIVTKDDGRIS